MRITDTQETRAVPSVINTSTFDLTQKDVEFCIFVTLKFQIPKQMHRILVLGNFLSELCFCVGCSKRKINK